MSKVFSFLVMCFIFQLGICSISAVGQDSLEISFEASLVREEKLGLALAIAQNNVSLDSPKALKYAYIAHNIALESEHDEASWKTSFLLADIYDKMDSLDQALRFAKMGIEYSGNDNMLPERAKSLRQTGIIHTHMGDYEKAGEYFYQALEIFEKQGNDLDLSNVLNNIGNLYYKLGDTRIARQFFSRSLEYAIKAGDLKMQAWGYNNLASVYETEQDYDKAEEYFKQASSINQELGNLRSLASNMMNLGIIHLGKGNYKESLHFLDQSLEIGRKLEDTTLISYIFSIFSSVYLETGLPDSAYWYASRAFKYGSQEHTSNIMMLAARRLEIYFQQNDNPDSSNHYALIYYKIQDSINKEEQLRRLSNLDLLYSFTKEKQIIDLVRQRSNLIRTIFIGALLATLLFLVMLYIQLRLKSRHQKQVREQLDQALVLKNKELTTSVMYAIKKNKILSEITTELNHLEKAFKKEETHATFQQIKKKIRDAKESNLWEEFEIRFQQVHGEFYNELVNRFPDLSQNEMRLCAFLKLDMTTKEISKITGQSLNAIEMARIRLRKKLGISKTKVNLITFLKKIP